jgi:predicted outer membrane repeat protein
MRREKKPMIKKQISEHFKSIEILFIILLTLLAGTGAVYANPLEKHVAVTGSDTAGDGTETNPFATIQAGIKAVKAGGVVLVHPGTYSETVSFNGKDITVKSAEGFAKTVIDGNTAIVSANIKGLVTFKNGEGPDSVLSGFTIINGSSKSGIYCEKSGPTLEDLRISHNSNTSGAGIFCTTNAYPVVRNSVISENSATNFGGGIYCKDNSYVFLQNAEITKNTAYGGGGIYCSESSGISLKHGTLADNSAQEQGSGILIRDASYITIENTIVWNNGIVLDDSRTQQSLLFASYSNIQGGRNGIITTQYSGINWLDGNINADPLFTDKENGDYHLQNCSPCIGAGIGEVLTDDMAETAYRSSDTDLEGDPRPNPDASQPDMGAYENPLESPISCDPRNIYVDIAYSGKGTGDMGTPYASISDAVRYASDKSEIRVAKGIYRENLTIEKLSGLKLTGGWNSGQWTRDPVTDPTSTTIMGFDSSADIAAVIYLDNSPDTLIQGFTIKGNLTGIDVKNSSDTDMIGNLIHIDIASEGAAGIRYDNSTGKILRNRILMFQADTDSQMSYGIALNTPATVRLENNILYLQGNILRGIQETGTGATPLSLLHNEFYSNGNTALYLDANGRGSVKVCGKLNDLTLNDIQERGGNFCNLVPDYTPCTPPCAEVVSLPAPEDTDGDTLPDNFEIHYFDDMARNGKGDSDGDGLTDIEEYQNLTDPTLGDTDGDGLPDAWEVRYGTNPLTNDAAADPDKDGYSNWLEYEGETDPNDTDSRPLAKDDIVTTDENTQVRISVLDNDAAEELLVESVTKPAKGKAVIDDTGITVTYTPSSGFKGIDSFEYTVANKRGNTSAAWVKIYVRPAAPTEKAVGFDGEADYLIGGPVNQFPSSQMTFEFWVKPLGTGTAVSYGSENSENGFSIAIDEHADLSVVIGDSRVRAFSFEDAEWHHIAITWASSKGKINVFKDGIPEFSGTLAPGKTIASGGWLVLGGKQACAGGCAEDLFKGQLDDLRVWRSIRTPEEIQANMNTHLAGYRSADLFLHWRFDEGTGQIVYDYSDNYLHAQLGMTADTDAADPQFITPSPLSPQEIYVEPSTGTGDTPINEAISRATPGSVIRISNGVYTETISVTGIEGLTIQGGWYKDETENWVRNAPPDPNFTMIMVMDQPAGLQLNRAPNTVVEGLAFMGAGMAVQDSQNVRIADNIIHIPDQMTASPRRSPRDSALGSEGISWDGSGGYIVRNRFHIASSSGLIQCITLNEPSGTVNIENNIFYLQGRNSVGILEDGTDAAPDSLLNNEFYGDEDMVLYQDSAGNEISDCRYLNDGTLDAIAKQGGNFCNVIPPYESCLPPCSDLVLIPPPEDTDGDDMPDNWEIFYFGSITRNGTDDADDDGRTDLDEYKNQTNPVSWDVKVTIRPREASEAGARWSSDGITWLASGQTAEVSGGNDVSIQFKAVPGWDKPSNQSVIPDQGRPIALMVNYERSSYTLALSKSGCEGKIKIKGELNELPWTGKFLSGERVNLEAVPDTDCKFAYWWSSGIVSTTNPIDVMMDGNMSVETAFTEKARYFPLPQYTSVYMDMTGKIYDSSNQTIPEGDEVAAFVADESGDQIIVGHALAYAGSYTIHVYGDDSATPEKDGAAAGDRILLKTYSKSSDTEYPLVFIQGDNTWEQGLQKECDWKYQTGQRIPLRAGWNLFSFSINKCYYVETKPECPMIEGIEYEAVGSISDILSSIDGQYSYVRGFDCEGAKVYNLTPWSTMKYMAAGYGYEIKINEDANVDANGLVWLELEGDPAGGDRAVPLHPGWNLVGYLGDKVIFSGDTIPSAIFPDGSMLCKLTSGSIGDALCSVEGQYSYIKGFDGTGIRSYNLGPWSNMTYVGPGYGYWIKINDGAVSPNLIWEVPCTICEKIDDYWNPIILKK